MIIKYDFLSELAGEMTEIEVDDELGKIVKEIEKNERKNDRTETRRHKYLSELEEQGYYIADDNDTFEEDVRSVQYKKLMTAIKELQPQQQELLFRVYWKKEKQKKIAAEEGVSEMAISNRMKKIIKKLKKFFE
ncbi:MAG: sigma-70 family RNA polymerase sigma factor [Ruminococcaceae bacterium]|nr:sigma-70 family RNA polymerase sigma factor [Oscillospiraceae bacterium]MBD5117021.1 sigma-70 family RNA polymerase sigma factor [Oscillospiraceae bacterium]